MTWIGSMASRNIASRGRARASARVSRVRQPFKRRHDGESPRELAAESPSAEALSFMLSERRQRFAELGLRRQHQSTPQRNGSSFYCPEAHHLPHLSSSIRVTDTLNCACSHPLQHSRLCPFVSEQVGWQYLMAASHDQRGRPVGPSAEQLREVF